MSVPISDFAKSVAKQLEIDYRPVTSSHEGIGLMLENFERLKVSVFGDGIPSAIYSDLIRLSATAERFADYCE
jgi:hypothetical protein